MSKEQFTFIKLGGSVITDKDVEGKIRGEQLSSLVKQIKQAMTEVPEKQLIVGHGSGSFGHVPAAKFETIKGFINEESILGAAIVQHAAAKLNREVVAEFIKNDIPAVTFAPSNTLIVEDHLAKQNFFQLLEKYLEKGLFPVTYGDVVVDLKQGWTVWSTEEVLGSLVAMFLQKGQGVNSVVHVTEVAGFLNKQNETVPEITAKNWPELKKHLGKTKGVDVTGGMALKIEESLKLAANGVQSVILSGLSEDNLYNYLVGKQWIGTKIT
jgi:isopentenyl phosphate kinase